MRTQIERARARHNDLVDELARLNRRLDKLDEQRMRAVSKKKKLISSVSRSSKRIDKLIALKTATAGPTASVSKPLVKAVADKPLPQPMASDPVPEFRAEAIDKRIVHVDQQRKMQRKTRRTPEDFRADMAKKKAGQGDRLSKS